MALTKKGNWWHADSAEDLDEFLLHVLADLCTGTNHRVIHARCADCGGEAFDLFIDEEARILRECTSCHAEWKICDLDQKLDEDSLGEIVCTCMYSECEVAVGFSMKNRRTGEAGASVTYLYVAGRCTECGLCGIYAEWPVAKHFPFKEWQQSV